MSATFHRLDLPALDGANPLGFLAALGTLAVLSEIESTTRLGWQVGARWMPYIQSAHELDKEKVITGLAERLRGEPVDAAAEKKREAVQKRFDVAKKTLKDAQTALKKRKLRGAEREAAHAKEVDPLKQAEALARDELLATLKQAVPSPELALGQRPDCTIDEFRKHAISMRADASLITRTSVDLLTSFGAEPSEQDIPRIVPTPFCFITGSGHQWFLDTARQLMATVSETKLREALFEPWEYLDEKLTMRWDPLDDRRYALMDRDPTASDNKSTTVWMANLLAYRALAFYPCAAGSSGLAATGWAGSQELDRFTWPIWGHPLSADTIRSLLGHQAFGKNSPSTHRQELRSRGVTTIFCAHRIQVGNPPLHKINFSQANVL